MTKEQHARITELYMTCFASMLYYAQSMLNDSRLAEEAVNDTFMIACRKYDDVFNGPRPEIWLRKTLKYVVLNSNRASKNFNKVILVSDYELEKVDSIVEQDHSFEFDEDIRRLLTESEYRLYQLVYVEKNTLPEASQELGISLAACKKRIQRLKEKIKKEYYNDKSPNAI